MPRTFTPATGTLTAARYRSSRCLRWMAASVPREFDSLAPDAAGHVHFRIRDVIAIVEETPTQGPDVERWIGGLVLPVQLTAAQETFWGGSSFRVSLACTIPRLSPATCSYR
jgi:hypothetical protein